MDSTSGRELFKFDRSLMERLSDGGMGMSQLNVQRRMRPNISHFVRYAVLFRSQIVAVLRAHAGQFYTPSSRTTKLSEVIPPCKAWRRTSSSFHTTTRRTLKMTQCRNTTCSRYVSVLNYTNTPRPSKLIHLIRLP